MAIGNLINIYHYRECSKKLTIYILLFVFSVINTIGFYVSKNIENKIYKKRFTGVLLIVILFSHFFYITTSYLDVLDNIANGVSI